MNLVTVLPEILKPISESILEGFYGSKPNGKDTVKIGALKVITFVELLNKYFGENGLREVIPMLEETMISSAIQKNEFPNLPTYLSIQSASIILISAVEIFLEAKGFFSFSGKKAYRDFLKNGFYISFVGENMETWEYSILNNSFSSVVRESEIMAELRTAGIV